MGDQNGTEQKKAFIVYQHDDKAIVKKYFIDVLEKECNTKCFSEKDMTPGETTIGCMVETIKECQKTFVVLTKSALKDYWMHYNMLLALEKSQRSGFLCAILFLFDVTRHEVQSKLFGVLSDAMMIEVNTNIDNWEEKLKTTFEEKLNDNPNISEINKAANLAVGQAWSHFTGYGRIVLPHLKDHIESSKLYKEEKDRFPTVEFNLLPNSAKTVKSLSELDEKIQFVGRLETIKADRGSFKDRPYDVSVYSIQDTDDQKYYFVGQIPNTLSILGKLEDLQSNWFKESTSGLRPTFKLSAGERSLQVSRFGYMYDRLVNHSNSKGCNDMVVLVPYDDTKENVVEVLLSAIKRNLPKKQSDVVEQAKQSDVVEQATAGLEKLSISKPDNRKVFIVEPTDSKDRTTATDIRTYLEKNGYQVKWETPGRSKGQNLEDAVKECKWLICVFSKKSVESENFPLMQFEFRAILTKCVDENELRVIPVVEGLNEDEISYDFHAVTFLNKQEGYEDKLLRILNCESIHMDNPVTAEGVHHGLAWAYVINYLCLSLQDREDHFTDIKKNNPGYTVHEKLLILVPSSCAELDLHGLNQDDVKFKEYDVGGAKKRMYQLVTYKITEHKLIVCVEYPNPFLCLQEMKSLQTHSGLSKLSVESKQFSSLVEEILSFSSVADKAETVFYDDNSSSAKDAIIKHCQKAGVIQ